MDGLQKQLERAMASQNYGEALVAVDALKRALECAESEASASEALDDSEALGPSTSDGASETEGDGRSGRRARLRPVASLVVSPSRRARRPRPSGGRRERSLVVSPGKASRDDDVDFVSDAVSMQKIFHLATGATGAGTRRVSVALHRVGGALVLDGALDDRLEDEASSWGDVDPETGEIIVMVKQKARSREKAAAALAAEGDATNLDNVELVEKGTCSKGEWHQFLSYYDDETEPEADESSDVRVAPIEGALRKRRQAHPELGEPAPFERRVTEVAALDMWLENTISGADDAAICYHKDGHVMGYQLVRTEDLPSFARAPAKRLAPDGDGATAVATLERAKSILRFVQRHCTDDAATPAPDGSDDDAPAPRPPKPGPLPAKILREFPVECSPDVEVNLSRGIKALISALRGGEAPAPAPAADRPRRRRKDAPADGNDLRACAAALVALYTALGEHYLAVDRLTKARHWSQGVELFRGLGDARSAAWLRARLAWAQLKLQDREGGAPTAAKRYAKTKAAGGAEAPPQTVLKLQVQKASLDQILAPPPDPAHLAAWKAAYAAALRMGADFDDDAPRLLALLRRTRDEAPTLAQDLA
ncbi:hypothetical protein JL720_11269 [Aureococcus anophagefferens]|nr:hypothetical protein JL720_11269 [Aureococcus anophagefferens]